MENFWGLRLESVLGSIFAKCSIFHLWECSEYALDSKYASRSKYSRVLNRILVLNMLGFWTYQIYGHTSSSKYVRFLNIPSPIYKKIPWKLGNHFSRKCKKTFRSRFYKKKYKELVLANILKYKFKKCAR